MVDRLSTVGAPSSYFPGFQRASLNMAYTADVLNNFAIQAFQVNNEKVAEQIREDAGFSSYLALALIGQNTRYLTGPENKTVIAITSNQAKRIVMKIRQLVFKNVIDGSDIPDDKIDAVYADIHNLIPADFNVFPDVFDSINH